MPMTHLRYFDEVVRTGSIRLAAERLRIAPSAISRQIRNIELDLGAPLLERHARGVVPTSAGEIYASYARSVLIERDRIRMEIVSKVCAGVTFASARPRASSRS